MADLEEGPIIAQGAELIGHAATLGNLVPKGRQMERRILTGAIGLHIADRVPVSGEREIVFRS